MEILSQTIEQSSGEIVTESREVASQTNNAIGALVAETDSAVDLCTGAAVDHEVDGGRGVHIDQTDLVATRILGVVHDTYLPALGMGCSHIEHTQLQAVQFFSKIICTQLHAAHLARRDVKQACQLQTALDSHRDVGDGTELKCFHR